MEFDDVVKGRRSIRQFRPDTVSETEVVALVDVARHAPSSMNGQPWHFVLIRSDEKKARLAEIKNRYCPPAKRAYPADFLCRAAWIVVVCVDREKSYGRELENAVSATTILLLAAHRRGFGAVFLTAHSNEEPGLSDDICALLDIPAGIVPVTIVPLGRPEGAPAAKDLTPLGKMIHVENF